MIIRGGRKELERRAADLLADALANVLARRPVAGFGVVGGRSVGNVLQLLGRAQVDWGRDHFFMLDERLVPPDHPDANYRLVASFVSSFLPPANLHPFLHEPGDKQAALLRYRRELENSAGRLEVL
ncbi:MAG: 6-phosphogluconolactonase, partial [Desulfofustis sp.]